MNERPFRAPEVYPSEMPAMERRRRDRCIAWGVSPRYEEINQRMSPRRGRQIFSLGREPQVRGDQSTNEPPEGATDTKLGSQPHV